MDERSTGTEFQQTNLLCRYILISFWRRNRLGSLMKVEQWTVVSVVLLYQN
jgi:hypothetical protein